MSDKGFICFGECTAKCVHLSSQDKECTSSYWGNTKTCTPWTVANSQGTPTKIKKWCCGQSKNVSETNETIRHLKKFRIISNKIPV